MLELREVTEAENSWQKIKRQTLESIKCQSEQLDLGPGQLESYLGFFLWPTQLAVGRSPAGKEFDLAVID